MTEVSIPVHPLSLRVLQSEYGQGLIQMSTQDPLFNLLTCYPLKSQQQRTADRFSEFALFAVNDALALHMHRNQRQIGVALFKFHKIEICKFVAASVMLGYKGGAKAALYVWLSSRGVTEDEYSLDSAYKLWQRFGWKIVSGKSTTFSRQLRDKSAVFLPKKRSTKLRVIKKNRKIKFTLLDIEIELTAQRFTQSLMACFLRPPKKLAVHARIYFYSQYSNLSNRQIAKKLHIHSSCVDYAAIAIRRISKKNITIRRILAEALPSKAIAKSGLPDKAPPPASSGHDSRLTRSGKGLHPHTRLDQAPGTNRSA